MTLSPTLRLSPIKRGYDHIPLNKLRGFETLPDLANPLRLSSHHGDGVVSSGASGQPSDVSICSSPGFPYPRLLRDSIHAGLQVERRASVGRGLWCVFGKIFVDLPGCENESQNPESVWEETPRKLTAGRLGLGPGSFRELGGV